MRAYGTVKNGVITAPLSCPLNIKGCKDFIDLTDEQKKAYGWYPCELVNYDYFPDYQNRVLISRSFDGDKVTVEYEVTDIHINAYKEKRRAEVNERRDFHLARSYQIPGTLYSLQMRSEADKINWLTLKSLAESKEPSSEITIRTESNDNITVTALEAIAIVDDMMEHCISVMQYSWQLKDSINICDNNADILAINITDGWPL